MRIRLLINIVLFVVLAAIPLVAEIITATPEHVPGTGFSILLYQPFGFAYVILTSFTFLALNIYFSSKQQQSFILGFAIGIAVSIAWFAITFLSVGQLHLSLGGKL
ncbi:MAG: hypothetical protein AAF304_07305 [Pseudomonadota bacterium]